MKKNTEKKEFLTDVLEQIDALLGEQNTPEIIVDVEDSAKHKLIKNLTNKENLKSLQNLKNHLLL